VYRDVPPGRPGTAFYEARHGVEEASGAAREAGPAQARGHRPVAAAAATAAATAAAAQEEEAQARG